MNELCSGKSFVTSLTVAAAKRGKRLTDIIKAAGLTVSYISDIQKGKATPSQDDIAALCSALEITPTALDDIYKDIQSKENKKNAKIKKAERKAETQTKKPAEKNIVEEMAGEEPKVEEKAEVKAETSEQATATISSPTKAKKRNATIKTTLPSSEKLVAITHRRFDTMRKELDDLENNVKLCLDLVEKSNNSVTEDRYKKLIEAAKNASDDGIKAAVAVLKTMKKSET